MVAIELQQIQLVVIINLTPANLDSGQPGHTIYTFVNIVTGHWVEENIESVKYVLRPVWCSKIELASYTCQCKSFMTIIQQIHSQ